jgi:hypothetical protein
VTAPEKPLNVRVAEALGCSPYQPTAADDPDVRVLWICPCETVDGVSPHGAPRADVYGDSGYWLRPYGEDSPEGWACTGPLIARFHIALSAGDPDWNHPGHPALPKKWFAESNLDGWGDPFPWHTRWEYYFQRGFTSAPEAAAELICNMAEAGRLPK